MDSFIANVNTTAMIIGYPVVGIIVFLILWFGTRIFRDINKIFNEMRYERRTRKNAEREMDNKKSSWMLELDEDNRGSRQIRHETLELTDIPRQLTNVRRITNERS